MNIGFVGTRFAGTDGVSLETEKWARFLNELGHNAYLCAGELNGYKESMLVPEFHFKHDIAKEFRKKTFNSGGLHLIEAIKKYSDEKIKPRLYDFKNTHNIEFLIIENALSLVHFQLPLAHALTEFLEETKMPAIAHHHDFWWERDYKEGCCIQDYIESFPPKLANLKHVVISSIARDALMEIRGIESIVIPNVIDFSTPPPGIDDYNKDFRESIELRDEDWVILQPTRVIKRKGIESAIELVEKLKDSRAKLVITHDNGDEDPNYLNELLQTAKAKGVDVRYVANIVGEKRGTTDDGRKIYSLWDIYPHANLVTLPSIQEGFCNAFPEAVYFKRPILINKFAVYEKDIRRNGFCIAEIYNGVITPEIVNIVRGWLENPETTEEMVKHNFEIAERNYSFKALSKLKGLLPDKMPEISSDSILSSPRETYAAL